MYKQGMNTHPVSADMAAPRFLQLAGHPLRWRLLGELARSDRIVQELTGLVGEPQNLVSYHLGKLRLGGLVSARRSAADGRDTYYGLDLARVGGLLAAAGGALHPGLRPGPSSRNDAPMEVSGRVLFLCTGNSARSQMAEALVRDRSGGAIEAFSAGSHPKPLHPNAVRVMRAKFDLDISSYKPKPLESFGGEPFDWVISLCDKVREVCPGFPGQPQTIHWSIANPATGESDDVTYPRFEQVAIELETRIGFLLAMIADKAAKDQGTEEKP